MDWHTIIGQKELEAVGINIQATDREDFLSDEGSLIQQVQNCLMTIIFCRVEDGRRISHRSAFGQKQ